MLNVDEYARIRIAHRDGMSIREIARRFGRSRQAVRKALLRAEPRPYSLAKPRLAPVLGPFKGLIEQILKEDERQPPKQRHTAVRIFERLRDEHGYRGSYGQVRRHVRQCRERQRETFVPLEHEPGQRVECDFGHIHVDFPEGRRLVSVLIVTWSWSYHCHAVALPNEKTESILHGMCQAFEAFGCVPREVWWDNPKTVVKTIFQGRERTPHPRYRALASHYRFERFFCLPRRGNEKPHVENRVKWLQRHWATPVPRVRHIEELNELLAKQATKDRERRVGGREETIGQRFEQEAAKALSLPAVAFDPCVSRPGKVDKYQVVRHETNWYSVPRSAAFSTVTLKAYVDRIVITASDGRVLAEHRRSYGRHEQVLDPLHYLATAEKRPAVLRHSSVYRDWQLPAAFHELQERYLQREGQVAGDRLRLRVLRLLGEHPAERVALAITECLARDDFEPTAIARRVMMLSQREAHRETRRLADEDCPARVRDVEVRRTGLDHFDGLLSQGGNDDARPDQRPAQDEPQSPAAADDAGRACGDGSRGPRVEQDPRGVPASLDGTGGLLPSRERLGDPDQASGLSHRQGPGGL